jgi:small subunit ribosomal protein S25e
LYTGTCSNWRQEAEEEVVQGQGYVIQHRTHSPSLRITNTSKTLESIITDVRNLTPLPRTLKTHRKRIATNSPIVKDKAQHAVVLDKQTNDKLQKDVQSYRLITVATLVDRLKINGSLARKALADLEANGQIKKVVGHSKLSIYSMSSQQCP